MNKKQWLAWMNAPPGSSVVGMCVGKVRFSNKDSAWATARKRGLRVYGCPWCHGFHCTSKGAR